MANSAQLLAVSGALILGAASPAHALPLTPTETTTDVQLGPTTEALHVLGVTAYVMDGTELGEVTDVKLGDHGNVSEIRVAMATPLGLGGKTVSIPIERCITLRGAVIVEMPISEVARLPAVDGAR
jgi:sporulation protein YlmC with PRC-barrel domain